MPFHFAMQKLPRPFYDRDTIIVAKNCSEFLVHISDGVERVGKIVETEAYLGRTTLRRIRRAD